jgi:serine/threonine protein kinase
LIGKSLPLDEGRADLYALGAVLYELLTGQVPFRRDHVPDLLEDIASLTVEARPPRQLVTDLPRELERICLKALAKRASDHYPTAHDFADDLCALLAQRPPQLAVPPPFAAAGPPPATPDSRSAFDSTGDSTPEERLAHVVPKGLRAFDAGRFQDFPVLLEARLRDTLARGRRRPDGDEKTPLGAALAANCQQSGNPPSLTERAESLALSVAV